MTFLPVILAGGCGTRLWPLSTPDNPKQFLPLIGARSLLQETVSRLKGTDAADPLVICSEDHRFIAAEQLRYIGHGSATFLLEPTGRSTAPAAALAALLTVGSEPDKLLLILPSDHLITDVRRFHAALAIASPLAASGKIVTFAVPPVRAETGYGYIERGSALAGGQAFAIARFVEKPDAESAQRFVNGGRHEWNSGMFMVRADRLIEELDFHRPDILDACRLAMDDAVPSQQFVNVDAAAYAVCPSAPLDRAIMEKTNAGVAVPLDAGWYDIGSWPTLWQALPHDDDGNALTGNVTAVNSRNNLVHADRRPVILLGVEDLVVAETSDAILIARRDADFSADDFARLSRPRQQRS